MPSQYSIAFKRGNNVEQKVNYAGNHSKSLYLSVEASLKKLRTDYIDILYIHWWDYETSVPEAMDSLHHLVAARKVLYLGISDTPAWVVAQANQYAIDHGKTPFVIYQGRWSVLERSFEREIIPMARSFGLALAPFQVLGGGRLRTEAEDKRRREAGEYERTVGGARSVSSTRTELEIKLSSALEKVANEVGAISITSGSFVLHILHRHLDLCHSRHRLCHAEDAIRLPYCRRTQGRATQGKRRSSGHHTVKGANQVFGGLQPA